MRHLLTLEGHFAASHSLPPPSRCFRVHGHTYRVHVTVQGEPDPDQAGLIVNEVELRELLAAATAELNLRSLNDMLAPALPSVQGVAGWLWERFALHYKMEEVTVWQDDLSASVRR